ncbi:cellulose-binding protein [Streptomyces sp. CRN 30]|uniref:cellulose-binding protein n=1 Tax=Streptomyces sp. CRN 30 TaxID=3075613 RepID=UPI002A7EDF4B|nr:cellulose-binding protein [Streptomyces sp. CRN 30]
MSSEPVARYGFAVVRRGYRSAQVDAYEAALSAERDAAWERAARLTVLAREMEEEAGRLREAVARLVPQTYEALGEGARQLFELGVEQAEAVRTDARREHERAAGEAEAAGNRVREAARAYADGVREEAEEGARRVLLAARTEADDVRITARREVKENRRASLEALREVRERTEGLLGEQEAEHAERWAEADRAEAGREAAADARHAELGERAEAAFAEARLTFAEAEESAAQLQSEAEARAAAVLAEARVHEDRVTRETDRVLREHGERADTVRAHMDHIRSSLTALTGNAPVD